MTLRLMAIEVHLFWIMLLSSSLVFVVHGEEYPSARIERHGYDFINTSTSDTHLRKKRSLDTFYCAKESCHTYSSARICKCDDECLLFRDCCFDANVTRVKNKTINKYVCRKHTETMRSWMVSDCPQSYTDGNVKEKCKTFALDSGDPLQMIPVHSKSRRKFFQNRYCAICHGVDISRDLSNLTVQLKGFESGCWILPSRDKRTFFFNILGNKNCFLEVVGVRIFSTRLCGMQIVDSCSSNFSSNSRRVASCKNGSYAPVFDSIQTYRNIHCALCNKAFGGNAYCGLYPPPLCVGHNLRLTLSSPYTDQGLTENGKEGGCKSNQVFDSIMTKCRQLFCGPVHVFEDGRCKEMVTQFKNLDMNISFSVEISPSTTSSYFQLSYITEYVGEVISVPDIFFNTQSLKYNLLESSENCTTVILTGVAVFTRVAYSSLEALQRTQEYVFSGKRVFQFKSLEGPLYSFRYLDHNSTVLCPLMNQSAASMLKPWVKLKQAGLQDKPCPQILLDNDEIAFLEYHHHHLIPKLSFYDNSSEVYICLEDFRFVMDSLKVQGSGSSSLVTTDKVPVPLLMIMAKAIHVIVEVNK